MRSSHLGTDRGRRWGLGVAAVVGVSVALVALPFVVSTIASAGAAYSDYVIVQTAQIPAGTASSPGVNEAMAECSPGDVAIGGGVDQGNGSSNALITSDGPLIAKAELRTLSISSTSSSNLGSAADGWEAEADDYTSTPASVTSYAVCQPPTGGAVGPTTVIATAAEIAAGLPSVATRAVTCPSGMQATGGGGDVDNPASEAIEGSAPGVSSPQTPTGWSMQFQRLNSSAVTLYIGVICAIQTGLANLTAITATNADAQCPSGSEATGGGLTPPFAPADQLLDSLPLVNGQRPALGTGPVSGWRATDGAIPFTVSAICTSTSSTPPTTSTTSTGSTTSTTLNPSLKPVTRLAGTDRVATAIAVSGAGFPTAGSAKAVVLARSDDFADALAGTPLAIAKGAPLLLTPPNGLDPRVQGEILRVAPRGITVYLLGGSSALAPSIDQAISGLGDTPVRLAGADRFATAVAIAHTGLGDPTKVLEATGLNFPDALSAGSAAGAIGAAILLTDDGQQAAPTAAYLDEHRADARWAVGGQAAAADPSATPLVGSDRFVTSAEVATAFFPAPTVVGAALGTAFPDALPGGAHIGALRGPLLLVEPDAPLPPSVQTYLAGAHAAISAGYLYGGLSAVGDDVRTALAEAIS